jgi:hypothetical protein
VLVALGLVLAVAVTGSAWAAVVRIAPPRRISLTSPFSGPCTRSNPNYTRGISVETSVAVDPRDPRRILVAWIQDGASTDLVMSSNDGGRSFSRILVPGLSACTGGSTEVASDPGVAFSSDGRVAYFSGAQVNVFSLNPFNVSVGMAASRSLDGGVSWSNPFMVQPVTHAYWDKPELSVDALRPRVAYYAYDVRFAPDFTSGYSLLSTTTNAGVTWSAPRKLYDPRTPDSWPGTSEILSNRDGSLLDVFVLASQGGVGPARVLAIRSIDRGRTWGKPIAIGRSSGEPVNDPVTQNILETIGTLPSQTVAPNGDVYVAWTEPGASNRSSRIAVARSSDGGRRWHTTTVQVRGQAALPAIAVAGDGTVGLLHYVIAPSSRAGFWAARVALATSRDGARHWSSSHPVAGPFNLLTAGSAARGCCSLNDYVGMARLPHGLVAAFPIARPLAKHTIDVYFTRITTSPGGG